MARRKPVSAPYYSIGQLRVDQWNELKTQCAELERCRKGSANEKQCHKHIEGLLKEFKSVEQYFAFPGLSRVEKLGTALLKGEYTALSNQVVETTRQLVSDTYRSNPYFLTNEDAEESDSREAQANQSGNRKHYFEVLFVENLSIPDEHSLRDKLREIRDKDETFIYDITVQRSFQDALIAIMFNHTIQAIVIRYAPPYRSANISPIIKPYIQNVLKLDLDSKNEAELGPNPANSQDNLDRNWISIM